MAATKVETHSPPISRDASSECFSAASCTSTLQLISIPRLCRAEGAKLSSNSPRRNHMIYAALASPPPVSLITGLCPSANWVIISNNKTSTEEERVKPVFTNHGVLGAVYFQDPMPSKAHTILHSSLTNISIFKAHDCLSHFLIPHKSNCSTPTESLIVPTLSQFLPRCPFNTYCTTMKSQNCKQLCKHGEYETVDFDVAMTTADAADGPGVATISNGVIGVEVSTGDSNHNLDNKEVCGGDDEIPGSGDEIHDVCNDIHDTDGCSTGNEYYSDSDDWEDDEYDCNFGQNPPHSPPYCSTSCESNSLPLTSKCCTNFDYCTEPGVAPLNTLLSDESGYCENYWQGDSLTLDSDGATEWDEDDDEGTGADESADSLWRSFEESIFSLQDVPDTSQKKASQARAPPTKAQCHELTTGHTSKRNKHKGAVTSCERSVFSHGDDTRQDTLVKLQDNISLLNRYACTLTSNDCTVTYSKKQVHFPDDSKISKVHKIVAWNFAYRAARRGHWEQFARDRAHFRRRIDRIASVLEPCLARKMAADVHV